MALVRKRLASVGTYTARDPDGKPVRADITPARIEHWVASGRRLLAAGVRTPVCWGHQLAAQPCDPSIDDPDAYQGAKLRAGDVVGWERTADGDHLDVILDVPGATTDGDALVTTAELADGRKVPTAIKEVSPLIGLDWTDGRGREWKDIIGHVALTPYPVQAGQGGFQALATRRGKGGVYLAGPPVPPKKADDEDDGPPAKPGEEADPAAAVADDLLEEAPEDDAGDVTAEDPAAGGEADRVSRITGNLATLGVPLQPDTDETNLLDRLDTALGLLVAMKQTQAQAQPAQPPAPKPPPQEAPAPSMLMAALPKVAQDIVRREHARRQKDYGARIGALVARDLPVATANRLRARVTGVRLALDAKGGLKPNALDRELALLEEVLLPADDPRRLLSAATPEAGPADAPPAEETVTVPGTHLTMPKPQSERIQAQARRIGAAPPPR
jgi:hypothetical protein